MSDFLDGLSNIWSIDDCDFDLVLAWSLWFSIGVAVHAPLFWRLFVALSGRLFAGLFGTVTASFGRLGRIIVSLRDYLLPFDSTDVVVAGPIELEDGMLGRNYHAHEGRHENNGNQIEDTHYTSPTWHTSGWHGPPFFVELIHDFGAELGSEGRKGQDLTDKGTGQKDLDDVINGGSSSFKEEMDQEKPKENGSFQDYQQDAEGLCCLYGRTQYYRAGVRDAALDVVFVVVDWCSEQSPSIHLRIGIGCCPGENECASLYREP